MKLLLVLLSLVVVTTVSRENAALAQTPDYVCVGVSSPLSDIVISESKASDFHITGTQVLSLLVNSQYGKFAYDESLSASITGTGVSVDSVKISDFGTQLFVTITATDNANETELNTITIQGLHYRAVQSGTGRPVYYDEYSTLLIDGLIPGSAIFRTINSSPTPMAENVADTTCSDNSEGIWIDLNASITNEVYSTFAWSATDNPDVTGESIEMQSNSYILDRLINLSTVPQTVYYSVTATAQTGGCSAEPFAVTVTVNPVPDLTVVNNKPIIPSGGITDIVFSSALPGASLYASGSGPQEVTGVNMGIFENQVNDTLLNSVGPAQEVMYWFRAESSAGCSSEYKSTTVTVNGYPSVAGSDSLALVALYNALDGTNWYLEGGYWLTGAANQWYGVEVQDFRVVSIDLSGVGAQGNLPKEIGDLTALRSLNISGTSSSRINIQGEEVVMQLKEGESQEPSGLTGTIPPEIGSLTNLEVLDLSGNSLVSPLPIQIFSLPSLRELVLSSNNFTGPIPEEIGSLSTLQILNLDYNSFTGSIPDAIAALSQLLSLDLSYNQLSGVVPPSFGGEETLMNLENFVISGNMLTGALPALKSTALQYLFIDENELTDVPFMGSVLNANLSYNRLTFEDLEPYRTIEMLTAFPQKPFSTPKIEIRSPGVPFEVSIPVGGEANQYQWLKDDVEIPEATSDTYTIANIENKDFGVYRLQVTSEYFPMSQSWEEYLLSEPITLMMPPNVDDSLAVVKLYENLGGANWTDKTNWLTDRLVSWHGIMLNPNGRVESIILENNNLSGTLPPELGTMADLKLLDLSHNSITSSIPPDYFNILGLKYFDLSHNQISGAIPEEIGNVTGLEYLDLSYNQLTDTIPVEIGNITGTLESYFHYLDLSNNKLQGSLPTLNPYANIYVDVRNNDLTGIPGSVYYSEMHVENNRLTFEDLEPYTSASPYAFTCFPQKPVPVPGGTIINRNRGQAFSVQVPVGGISNQYQWLKDSVEIPEAVSDQYDIEIVGTDDFGVYQLVIKNSAFYTTNAYLVSEPVHLVMTKAKETDSLAMVALYNSLGGPGWKDKSNWLEGPLDSWYGVTVTEGRVRNIILMNNNLAGTIPAAIGNLSELTYLELGCDEPSPTSKNNITGTIPNEILNLPNLGYINLSFNSLTGAVPDLTLSSSIGTVYLNDNELTDLPDLSSREFEYLDIRNNRFTFEDLEPNIGLSINYWSQKPFSQPQHLKPATGDNFTTTLNVGGSANLYQWKRNGEDVSGATSNTLSIPNIIPSQGGKYVLVVTNPIAPDATLHSDTIQITVITSTTDSLALVALYNATGGGSWTNKTNWLTGPVDTWHGITVTEGRVAKILLTDNNLTGSIPPEIGNLIELKELWLSSNKLTGAIPIEITNCTKLLNLNLHTNSLGGAVPDLTAFIGPVWVDLHDNNLETLPNVSAGNFSHLNVQNNLLTFEDIEPNMSLPQANFAYYPQKRFSQPQHIKLVTGDNFTTSFTVGGTANQYQWKVNGQDVPGATTNTLSIPNIAPSRKGKYLLAVTNTLAPNLTLLSDTIYLDVITSTTDSLALVALYNAAGGGSWTNKTNWLTGAVDTWHGITITDGRVTEIRLSDNNLTGSIAPELGNIATLTYLNLGSNTEDARSTNPNRNRITGTIPPALGSLTQLTYLNISSNDLTGALPETFSALTQLRELWLTGNNLSLGAFPSSILAMTQLQQVMLAYCGITGALPTQISSLNQLQKLVINNNQLVDLPDLKVVSSLQNVRVANNRLTFEDLEPNVALSSFNYVPQDSVGVKSDILIQTGTPHTFKSSVAGSANQYQWKKNGTAINGATAADFVLQSPAFSDEGVYTYEVTNTVVPGLTLAGRPVNVRVSSLQRDSLALVQLYTATKGNTWTNKTNWTTGRLATWAGVTISSNRVTDINLPDNNLDGAVPGALNEMLSLKTVNFSNNKINELPLLSALTQLTSFNVSGNRLHFNSLEPNASLLTVMNYTNQAEVGISKRDSVETSAAYALTAVVNGANNQYQWKRNDSVVQGAVSATYNIASLDRTNMGTYVCEVTNTQVPGLVIKSAPQTVLAITDLSGLLVDQSSQPLSGRVTLFRIKAKQGYDTIKVVNVDGNGAYSFKRIALDNYQVMGFPDTLAHPRALPTYYRSTPYWEEADTIVVQGPMTNLNVIAQFKPSEAPVGEGVISGVVEQDDGLPGGRVKRARRIEGAGVSVRRVETTGRGKDGEILVLVAFVFTNENGEFTINNLPPANYRINIQYPGVPMDETSFIDIPIGTGNESKVTVSAVVTDEKITVREEKITGIPEQNVYPALAHPNPARESITVSFERASPGRSIELTDVTGSRLLRQTAHDKDVVVDVHALQTGLYMITVKESYRAVKTLRVMIK